MSSRINFFLVIFVATLGYQAMAQDPVIDFLAPRDSQIYVIWNAGLPPTGVDDRMYEYQVREEGGGVAWDVITWNSDWTVENYNYTRRAGIVDALNNGTTYELRVRETTGTPSGIVTGAPGVVMLSEAGRVDMIADGSEVETCSGTFSDGVGNYPIRRKMTLTLAPDTPGNGVRVVFSSFDLEPPSARTGERFDYLGIWHGDEVTMNRDAIGLFAGSTPPPPVTSESPDGKLTFFFQSDYSVVKAGWEATISCVQVVPDPPTSLTASPISETATIDLSWSPPTNMGEPSITGYEIESSTDGEAPWAPVETTDGATTAYSHATGLAFGATIHYRVSATNDQGTGQPSSVVEATVWMATAPEAPTSLVASPSNGITTIALSWDEPVNNGGSLITGYKIQSSTNGTDPWTDLAANTGTTATTYSHTDLTGGETIHYRVSAINVVDTGQPSNVVQATVWVAGADAPDLFLGPQNGSMRVIFGGSNPGPGLTVSGYEYQMRVASGPAWTETWISSWSPTQINFFLDTFTFESLTNGTTYEFRVRAATTVDADSSVGAAGEPATASGTPGVVMLSDGKIELTASGSEIETCDATFSDGPGVYPVQRRMTLTLAPDTPGNRVRVVFSSFDVEQPPPGGGLYDYLAIYHGDETTNEKLIDNFPGNTLPPPVTSVSPDGKLTFFFLSDVSDVGQGWEATISCVQVVPDPPTSLTASPISETATIDLSWSPPTNMGEPSITGYEIESSTDGEVPWAPVETTDGVTTAYSHATGLTFGATIHYRVSATNDQGTGQPSSVVEATVWMPTAPDPPTTLSATSTMGDTTIVLGWSEPVYTGGTTITGYKIEQSTNAGTTWADVETTTTTTTAYTHTGLTFGETIHYRVSAINDQGTGQPSNVVQVTVSMAPTVPEAPTNLMASPSDGIATIELGWSEPTNTGGNPITGYKIQSSTNGTDPWTNLAANTGTTATTYSHTDLTGGETIHYRVSAINSEGPGEPSIVVQATVWIEPVTAPDAPTNPEANPSPSTTTIVLTWTAPTGTGGAEITGYRIERSPNGTNGWMIVVDDTGDANTYSHTNLTAGETIHYRVSAINSEGPGEPSIVVQATVWIEPATAPDAPTNPAANPSPSTTTIVLTWTAPTSNGGAEITGYRIERSPNGTTGWMVVVDDTGDANTYSHTNLTAGETIHYRVSAINSEGPGEPSTVVQAMVWVEPVTAPGAPTNPAANPSPSTTTIVLTWTAPTSNGGAEITGYLIERSPNGTTEWMVVVDDTGDANTYSHTNLTAGETIHYRVSAINSEGPGEPSIVVQATVRVEPVTAPDAPTNPAANPSPSTTTIVLTWTAPTSNGGAEITGYLIERSPNGTTEWMIVVDDTGDANTYSHTNLTAGETIHYRVSAINSEGPGEPSIVVQATVRVEPVTAPDAPTNPAANPSPSTTTIVLTWTAPTSNGEAEITGYLIERSPNGTTEWMIVVDDTGNANTYSHTNLTAGETIHYRVSAINSEGPGEPSIVVQATVVNSDPPLSSPTHSLPTVKVYPNPAVDVLYLDLEEGQDYAVALLSLAGELVLEEYHRDGGSLRLALPDIRKGVYILQVQSGEGKVHSFKIVR